MTPLEKARKRESMMHRRVCLTCENLQKVGCAMYCGKSGKLLHPLLIDPSYNGPCPEENKEAST